MVAEGKPKSEQFHFFMFYSFFYQVFLIDAYFIMKYPIIQKSQLHEAHFSWEYSYLSFFMLVLHDVRSLHKVTSLGALHAHLRLAITDIWSSNGHIPELPTEGTHLLCSENPITIYKGVLV